MSDQADITRVFELQRNTAWTLKQSDSAARKAKLVRLRDRLMQAGEEVSEALYQDMARPKAAMPFDVQNAIDTANEAIDNLDQWMAPTPVAAKSTDAEVNAYVHYEARGVILILGPWNFPFHLCFEPLIYAIAAGNSAIIKPSELTPATSAIVTRIVRELFDESEVAVFEGGADVATMLLEKPFDHIFMTGSPKVGKIVMTAAAKNLASVTLELGGKNPAIIDQNADIEKAAYQIMLSRIMNAGQVCLSIDYVLAPSESVDLLAENMVDAVKGLVYTDGRFDAAKQGRFVNRNNFDRVRGYVDEAVSLGARVILGGGSNADDQTMEPTILTDVPANAAIMHEEIFGRSLSSFPTTRSKAPSTSCGRTASRSALLSSRTTRHSSRTSFNRPVPVAYPSMSGVNTTSTVDFPLVASMAAASGATTPSTASVSSLTNGRSSLAA